MDRIASIRSRPLPVLAAAVMAISGIATATPLAPLSAQQAYPQVEVRQVMGSRGGEPWGGTARVDLDRDAFVVVLEIGADSRARVVFPETPRDRGFVRADRRLYVPLPSADVMFIRAQQARVPTIVAFASDVAPDLTAFAASRNRWEYQFAVDVSSRPEDAVRDLAMIIFGDPDMPYSVSQSAIAPSLSIDAQRMLASCGYNLGTPASADFYRFLWDMYGPFPLSGSTTLPPVGASSWYFGSGMSAFIPFPLHGFSRSTESTLWNAYGSMCDPLMRRRPLFMAVMPVLPVLPGDSSGVDTTGSKVPVPRDRQADGPPSTVDEVGIIPAAPAAARRDRITASSETGAMRRTPLVREASEELIQRRDMADLVARRAAGAGDVAANGRRGGSGSGFGPVARSGRGSTGSTSRADAPARGGSASSGGSSSARGSTAGSGSAGSSSAGRSTETRAGSGGRSETGRPGTGGRP